MIDSSNVKSFTFPKLKNFKVQSSYQSSCLICKSAGTNSRTLNRQLRHIKRFEEVLLSETEDALLARTYDLRHKVDSGLSLEAALPEAFALVAEASFRVLDMRPFDEQLFGGIVLHNGNIAEMQTGEGKTLVAALPAFLNALQGNGVHIVTPNDYLAKRDSEWIGQVLKFLGLSVGLIQASLSLADRKKAYLSDITYVTNSELGFDFLRDNLAVRKEDISIYDLNYAIVDEVDSVLIDEATSPLIVSGPSDVSSSKYKTAKKLAETLRGALVESKDVDYVLDLKDRSFIITEEGYNKIEDYLKVKDIHSPGDSWNFYISNALRAKEFLIKNVDYIVNNNEVVIIDKHTGRLMPGRRWGDGLHQAVETKENVPIKAESMTTASISYQGLMNLYTKLSGMTGTAYSDKTEFLDIYGLKVVQIPTRLPLIRKDLNDLVFRTKKGAFNSAVKSIMCCYKRGQPVLVGTANLDESEYLAEELSLLGVPHQLLNARPENLDRESEIVAQCGRLKAVTIATNMAGRGTDIVLGGNAEAFARYHLSSLLMSKLKSDGFDVKTPPDNIKFHLCTEISKSILLKLDNIIELATASWGNKLFPQDVARKISHIFENATVQDEIILSLRQTYKALKKEYERAMKAEKEAVKFLGGLHVIGMGRHESRRIDNQLIGRSGRQGNPGSSQFYLSFEDELLRVFGSNKLSNLMFSLSEYDDVSLDSKILSKAILEAQKSVESIHADQRKTMYEYDMVLGAQRADIYKMRRNLLVDNNSTKVLNIFIQKVAGELWKTFKDIESVGGDACKALTEQLGLICNKKVNLQTLVNNKPGFSTAIAKEGIVDFMLSVYKDKIIEFGKLDSDVASELQKSVLLHWIDEAWQQQLQRMSFLQKAVMLRGYGQREPLAEYKLLGLQEYSKMITTLCQNVLINIYHANTNLIVVSN